MTFLKSLNRGCMRLGTNQKYKSQWKAEFPVNGKINGRKFTRREIVELFFEDCIGWELTPLKYNSKLMNSIWGLYNRYSVHNFKKNTDSNEGPSRIFAAASGVLFGTNASAANAVAAAAAGAKNSTIMPNGNSL